MKHLGAMFFAKKILTNVCINLVCKRCHHVTVIGGATDIGQTVCLLLKSNPNITKLHVYDAQRHTPGVVLDVSHIPTESRVQGFSGENLSSSIKDADLILITGGVALLPGMNMDGLMRSNTQYIRSICGRLTKGPMPFIGIVAEPINTLVPMAAEILKSSGAFNTRKLFGISGIDQLRAQCLYGAECMVNPSECFVPVIGGHSSKTLVPLWSNASPGFEVDSSRLYDMTNRLRGADEAVVRAKAGWSPTLSMAYSALAFTEQILRAVEGQPTQLHAFVENNDFGTHYFAGLVSVDADGAGDMARYDNLSPYELHLLERSILELRKEITHGRRILEVA